ncbi:sensor domain-containing diguanylate cyclase [Marinomonas epiphytica]
METFRTKFLKLNHLILLLALSATVITFVNSFYSVYEVQKEQLINQNIEINRSYARKLADTTEVFIIAAKQQLEYSAIQLGKSFDNENKIQAETDRLREQNESFNSVVVSDAEGLVLSISPEALALKGRRLTSKSSLEAIAKKSPHISEPFVSPLKNLLVSITAPIFNENFRYMGFVGGTIYLKEANIMSDILASHYYQNGSYVYVIDKSRQVLFHPNNDIIGTSVDDIEDINQVLKKQGGTILHRNDGAEMLAGFAEVPSTGWIVITQSPVETALAPLSNIMEKVILKTFPLAMTVFVFIWLFARAIAKPLQLLARQVKRFDEKEVDEREVDRDIEDINSWYSESSELKKAITFKVKDFQTEIGKLKLDADTDPLTGAKNRRALQYVLDAFHNENTRYSALCLDIDHFKSVNDTYGHDVGDQVLKKLVSIMNRFSRTYDLVARTGGEEFILVIKDANLEDAMQIAERLRESIESEYFETVNHITVSVGVACTDGNIKGDLNTPDALLKKADKALYEAKHLGRNRCQPAN